MLCDFAVADLTSGNANVYYELGVRHGIRPHSTMLVFAEGTRLPFDLSPLRGMPYALDASGAPDQSRNQRDREAIANRLRTCFEAVEDSPLFQLVPSWPRADIEPLRRALGSGVLEELRRFKQRLERAREAGAGEVAFAAIEADLSVQTADPAIIVDLLAAYRSVNAFRAMIALIERAPPLFARTVYVREQQAFALNRLGQRREAERMLLGIIAECGPNPETNGLLGRVYKDGWREATARGQALPAASFLAKAIEAYLRGFEADWRHPYPALNAATLMEAADPVDVRQRELLPVVHYAARHRAARAGAGYWEYASLTEACVLVSDRAGANAALADALTASDREDWFLATTADNMRIIADGRTRRGLDARWIEAIEAELRGIS
jgi:tetratricopeptide (TPR) repeat protein